MTAQAAYDVNRLPCGWLSLDAHGRVVAVNDALCRMLGASALELQGKPFDRLLTRPSRVLYQSYLQPLLHLHGHVEEFSLAFDLGSERTLDTLIYSTPAASGAATAQSAMHVELVVASLRKRRSIEDEMLRIKRAADHAPGMIFQLMQLADGQCHFPYTSEAIRRMYGVTSQQASESAEHLLCFLDSTERVALSQSLRDAAHATEDWSAVFQVTLPGAPARWHEARATPRRLANGVTLWHGHCADVTDRRALEMSVADRLAQQRMHEARSEFLARVSHELRTPLNSILGFAQLLASDKADNLSGEQLDRLALLASSGRHLLALVNEVLEVTTLESGQLHIELQPLELRPLLQRSLQAVAEQARQAQVQLLPLNCPPGLQVCSNEQRLHQALVNLLSNAIKYNHPAGTVQLTAQESEKGVQVAVIDTGVGMLPEQVAALFQPFNRLGAENSAVEGSGLGLVITQHLLQLMQATLSVHSERGQGSTFSMALPAGRAVVGKPEAAAQVSGRAPDWTPVATPAPRPTSGRVLYVEDDEVNAILMAAVLGMRPQIRLQVAATGALALQAARAEPPDLLLLDMHLPDTNGVELLAQLRLIDGLQTVPAIMVSAGARQEDFDRARNCGFVSYWTKPFNVDQTLAELDHMLGAAPLSSG